jgi:hypothetical protein
MFEEIFSIAIAENIIESVKQVLITLNVISDENQFS